MTDNELKFFDPETGRPLHRVPVGATIPTGTPYGFIRRNGSRGWVGGGTKRAFDQLRGVTYFTREPIGPPLPTEPGLYLDKDGVPVERTGSGEWYAVGSAVRLFDTESYAPLTPATAVPTETWDRLRALDPEDKRDRVDVDGDFMEVTTQSKAEWGNELAARHWYYGPLRFADEVSDR